MNEYMWMVAVLGFNLRWWVSLSLLLCGGLSAKY